jgi:GTP-binding protein
LLNELEQFNPELLDKKRILVISKCDLIDSELEEEMKKQLPALPCVFISAVANKGIIELKDLIWKELNS